MAKEHNQSEVSRIVRQLFSDAEKNGGIDYIYTLIRVTGIEEYQIDPILSLNNLLKSIKDDLRDNEILSKYQSIIGSEEPFELIVNLINCVQGERYDFSPFMQLRSGTLPNIVKPSFKQIVIETANIARKSGMQDLSEILDKAFPEQLLRYFPIKDVTPDMGILRVALKWCLLLFSTLLGIYFSELLKFRNLSRLYKQPGFEVLELLVNNEAGLYGFKMHFSNGSSSKFVRGSSSTECINITLEVPINFMVGLLDELKQEWRIGEKRLYEIGLPGRYNKPGEWKPIIYPGDSDPLAREAHSMSEDPDVMGSIFYMMCTGHRVIEFVVRSSIEMPLESFSFGKKINFYRCPSYKDIPSINPNFFIYDGWLELESTDLDYIRSAIAGIGIAVNRMAFAYDQKAEWRLKYRMTMNQESYATPDKEDLQILDKLLKEFPKTEDAIILDAAIDWYNRGMSSRNVFTAFLCHYIALESVALAVAEGDADLGLDYHRESKKERKQRCVNCIDEIRKSFGEDPVVFVREAYLKCIYGITEKVRRVTEKLFGPNHQYLNALFEKKDGYSLSDIRSMIAHGEFTLINRDDEALVWNRLPEIIDICKEFLVRATFILKPTESLPNWSHNFAAHMPFNDPRYVLVVSKEAILPTTDWRIRAEWCD